MKTLRDVKIGETAKIVKLHGGGSAKDMIEFTVKLPLS